MTIAQSLMNEGREKHIAIGLKRGREEGREERTIEIAKKMLLQKIDREIIKLVTGFSDEILMQLTEQ